MVFFCSHSLIMGRCCRQECVFLNISPAFLHAKSFVCDDEIATVGTINLDYRSLYLHFECGVWLYRSEAVLQNQGGCTFYFWTVPGNPVGGLGESQSAGPDFSSRFCACLPRFCKTHNKMMMPGSKGQKAVHACMIRLLNLGPPNIESSDLRSKSADFECLQNCGSCFAAEQFVGISWGKIPFDPGIIIIKICPVSLRQSKRYYPGIYCKKSSPERML